MKKNRNNSVLYTLKFYSLYLPASIKNVSLYSRSTNYLQKQNLTNKILVKQSYILLIWLKYITVLHNTIGYQNEKVSDGNLADGKKVIPSFFIYPTRSYKFTSLKSPMAHKTFSQEQFLCKNYKLSISFKSDFTNFTSRMDAIEYSCGSKRLTLSSHINNSLYFTMFFFKRMPSVSTNMFLIQRSTLRFYSRDRIFFSLFAFIKTPSLYN